LSGNRSHPVAGSSAKDDGNHVVVFSATDFNLPEINLTHGGLILIALLSGGDYHQAGLSGCGPKVACGLARCGFGDSLLSAARTLTREDLQEYLVAWKKDLGEELRTDSRGILGRRYTSLSKAIPEEFPDVDILMSYSNPITSETEGKVHKIKATWERPLDLGRIANICELYFEWGVRHVIIKRFRTMIWPAAVLRFLRESVLEKDMQKVGQPLLPTTTQLPQKDPPSSSPTTSAVASLSHLRIGSSPTCQDLILKIHSVRNHDSTDGLLEYRLEVSPERLIALASAGIKDIRPPLIADISSSDGATNESDKRVKKPPPDPSSNLRVWISACIVRAAMPSLVDSFDEMAKRKAAKKTTRTKPTNRPKRAGPGASPTPEDTEETRKREPRPKQDLKAFYSVIKPQEHALKPVAKPLKDDHPVVGRRSKILSLIDDFVAADASKRDNSKAPPTPNCDEGGFPATKAVAPRLADRRNQSRPPVQVQAHPTQGPEDSPDPTPTLPQKEPTPGEVIEISSDSDESDPALPPAKPKVAPLLVARSRSRARPQIPDDIIDLT
jgi:Holliday junction resolvase YEN1